MKIRLIVLALFLFGCNFASAQSKPKTVVFPKGKNTVTLSGNTVRDNSFVFRLTGEKRIVISLTSTKGNAVFYFDLKRTFDQGLDFMCEECTSFKDRIGRGLWMISVDDAVDPDKGPTDFVLKITLN